MIFLLVGGDFGKHMIPPRQFYFNDPISIDLKFEHWKYLSQFRASFPWGVTLPFEAE
ncbi:MAG: hypothetical protein P1V20_03475 [Verrucomicrobiales bacterium]|nr:hypothetical protein [Verrucomicrobiales bacterium]